MTNLNSLLHPVRINSRITIPGNLFLAPMAGFTDAAFRHICISNGSDMCWTEMVSCEALSRKSLKTKKILFRAENEKIYAVQVFCSSPETAASALEEILPFEPLLIDLNCGCPVPKIIKSGAGSALMRNPEKIMDIVKALSSLTDIPVTVKLRSGWDAENINYLKAAEYAVKGGAQMITLHPRTKTQGYSGKADWEKIRHLKTETNVPVIGSGDLFSPLSCLEMLETTGCDAVMVARGAVGKPEIFKETKILAETGELPDSGFAGKLNIARAHLELAAKYIDEKVAVNEIKKHLCSYIKGVPGSAGIRNRIVHCASMEEYRTVLDEIEGQIT
ncbi:MAG: tRNA dihydrouridine synthase DusB [Spirochaetia bacterium]|jgi:nifR3 family TIM-barrel protein|nr:tRNA dihydrouridine synthase DusB [Spirochaetia bacterium]